MTRINFSFANSHSQTMKLVTAILILFGLAGCSASSWFKEVESDYYRVKRGDTLSEIGQRFGVSATLLAQANHISDPRLLREGQIIRVRGHDSSSSPGSHTRASMARVAPPSAIPQGTKGHLGFPVQTGQIVSGFGPRNSSFHDGIDIKAPTGTPIYAAHDGVVAYSGSGLTGYGKLILLRAPSGLMTVYAHNDRLLAGVNANVKRGQQIATVGATGRASGPHLHFEVRVKNSQGRYLAVDPMPLFQEKPRKNLRYRINDSLSPILARFGR